MMGWHSRPAGYAFGVVIQAARQLHYPCPDPFTESDAGGGGGFQAIRIFVWLVIPPRSSAHRLRIIHSLHICLIADAPGPALQIGPDSEYRIMADDAKADGGRTSLDGGVHRGKMPALGTGEAFGLRKRSDQEQAPAPRDFAHIAMGIRQWGGRMLICG
jgi:hypothetical protein